MEDGWTWDGDDHRGQEDGGWGGDHGGQESIPTLEGRP